MLFALIQGYFDAYFAIVDLIRNLVAFVEIAQCCSHLAKSSSRYLLLRCNVGHPSVLLHSAVYKLKEFTTRIGNRKMVVERNMEINYT